MVIIIIRLCYTELVYIDKLIMNIRTSVKYSQKELAEALSVTFASINKWENARAVPNKLAQIKLYEFCKEKNINIFDMILQKIKNEAISINTNGVILYHGSKEGLIGGIAPKSRARCDFGKGFYMGNEAGQPLTLVCDFEHSHLYIISLDLKDLEIYEIDIGLEWAMLIAYNRGKMETIKNTAVYNKYKSISEGCDVIIGYIADDRMFYVLDRFFEGDITDTALVSSLAALKLGRQYFALTQKACDKVKIEKEIVLYDIEKLCLKEISAGNREKGISLANDICREHRREGKYFDEILAEAQIG